MSGELSKAEAEDILAVFDHLTKLAGPPQIMFMNQRDAKDMLLNLGRTDLAALITDDLPSNALVYFEDGEMSIRLCDVKGDEP